MSEVWAADDLELDRTVAVKLLAPERGPRPLRARGARGGRRSPTRTSAPSTTTARRPGGGTWCSSTCRAGRSRSGWRPGRPLPDAETERIAGEIAAGLAHAHERGLVHRDLKPSNVLFDAEGRAKIADFGIAHMDAATGLTEAGTVLGTAAYISPEQAAGEPATPASDVYAFGVILFRMLTGRLPFEAPDALALAAMHRDRPPPPVSELRPDAPPRSRAWPWRRSPRARPTGPRTGAPCSPSSAGRRAARTTPPSPPAWRFRPPASSKRKRTALVAIAVAVLAAAGVALAVGLGSDNSGPDADGVDLDDGDSTSRPATTTSPVVTPAPSTAETTSTEATTTATTASDDDHRPRHDRPPTTTTTPATTSRRRRRTTAPRPRPRSPTRRRHDHHSHRPTARPRSGDDRGGHGDRPARVGSRA